MSKTDKTDAKDETILEESSYMVDSYSSKIQEVILSNNNGIVNFENLSVENVKTPLKEGDPKPETR